MNFDLEDDERLLADGLARYLGERYSFAQRRSIIRSAEGWSRPVWNGLAELGLLALHVPEDLGGSDGGAGQMHTVMMAFGRALLVEPYLPSAILATRLVRALGTREQQRALLPSLASGARIVVPAHDEPGAHHDITSIATSATTAAGGYSLTGRKAVVLHAPAADHLLVSARIADPAAAGRYLGSAGDVAWFVVDRAAPGVTLLPYRTLDGLPAADVVLSDVRTSARDRLGPVAPASASEAIAAVWEVGVAALCAEAVGALDAVLEATIEHVKTRKQFGVQIGAFQAIQHRLADMLGEVEQARSMSLLACVRCFHSDAVIRARAVSAAKVLVGQACRRVGQEAVQLHGAMGMTDELSVSHYFKRLWAIDLSLGDIDHHMERFIRVGRQAS